MIAYIVSNNYLLWLLFGFALIGLGFVVAVLVAAIWDKDDDDEPETAEHPELSFPDHAVIPSYMRLGAAAIAVERSRQIKEEGFTPAHDAEHETPHILARAAQGYLQALDMRKFGFDPKGCRPSDWPWDVKWWKPTDNRRDLVKAGALIAAAIDMIDRETETLS